jgi:hypothetical protein
VTLSVGVGDGANEVGDGVCGGDVDDNGGKVVSKDGVVAKVVVCIVGSVVGTTVEVSMMVGMRVVVGAVIKVSVAVKLTVFVENDGVGVSVGEEGAENDEETVMDGEGESVI